MSNPTIAAFASVIFALSFTVSHAPLMPAQSQTAQESAEPSSMLPIDQYLMDRDVEIAMARSAAPPSIARDASVMVLGRHGYKTAVEGANGFVCVVGRSWALPKNNPAYWDPKIHGPICLTSPGARSYLPVYLRQTELAIAGKSPAQIEHAIVDAVAKGELSSPEPGSLSYMMSKQGYLNATIKGPWLPHVMIFVPEIDPKSLGAGIGDDVPLGAHEEKIGRYTTIEIPVSNWSDGTPSPHQTDHH